MDTADVIQALTIGLIATSPALVVWIAAVIVTAMLVRRSGGKAERLLLAGAVIYLVSSLLLIPSNLIISGLMSQGPEGISSISTVSTWIVMLRKVIGMAGLICFINAFWVKFNIKDSTLADTTKPG